MGQLRNGENTVERDRLGKGENNNKSSGQAVVTMRLMNTVA